LKYRIDVASSTSRRRSKKSFTGVM